jgi:hypothetical protein
MALGVRRREALTIIETTHFLPASKRSPAKYGLVCLLAFLTSACVTYYDPMQSAQKPGVKMTRATIIDTAKAEGKTSQ